MTDDELKAIKARAEAALGGPCWDSQSIRWQWVSRAIIEQDVPALVAEVERLRYALASCAHARDLNQARARKAEVLIAEVVPQFEWLISERDTYDLQENGIPSLLEKLKAL